MLLSFKFVKYNYKSSDLISNLDFQHIIIIGDQVNYFNFIIKIIIVKRPCYMYLPLACSHNGAFECNTLPLLLHNFLILE